MEGRRGFEGGGVVRGGGMGKAWVVLTHVGLGCVQIWAVNTAGQLELTFSCPEEENPADSRSVSVQSPWRDG